MTNPRHAARLLLDWYETARRDLPWRRTKDPWRILVSEVMLQQTRVTTVLPYYERFLARFPRAEALAVAEADELLALWAGLGYYSRARNLQRAAQALLARGGFPSTYEGLRALPGVGDYTAAAIASICFGLPTAVVDGNVVRVLARAFGEAGDTASAQTRIRLREHAQRLLDPRRPADFNQALMELGATVCVPKTPQCLLCPWRGLCVAQATGRERELPVKRARREPQQVLLELLLVERNGAVLLGQRATGQARLAGFWELPEASALARAERGEPLGSFPHTITHHNYTVKVWRAQVEAVPEGFRWFKPEELTGLPLATMTRKALALRPGYQG